MIDHTANPDTAEGFDLEVAPRVRGLPPYLFGKINDLKYRKRVAGIDVIDLGMGNPTDPPEQWVIDKLCEAAHDLKNHRYSVAAGVYNLRREVAAKYANRFGVTIDPDHEVVATIGSKEGFSHMCLALLGPGDTALAPAPSFPIHMHAVALASANVITLDVRDPQAFLANVARVCESLFPRPKILILNFPHNPTGTIVERAFYDEVVALAKKYHFFVISDFAYGDIVFDNNDVPSFLSARGAIDVGCEFTTMSKGYNMAGWRVGSAAGKPERCSGRSRRSRGITTTACSRPCRSPRSWPSGTASRGGSPRWPSISSAATCSWRASGGSVGRSRCPRPGCSPGPRSPSRGSRRWGRSTSP